MVEASLFAVTPPRFERVKGGVDIIGPHVDVERLARRLCLLDEAQGGLGKGLGDDRPVFPLDGAVAQFRRAQVVAFQGLPIEGVAQGEDAWSEPFEIGQGCVETVFGDEGRFAHVALAAHMPLAEVARGVTRIVEDAREHGGLRVQPLGHAPFLV